MKPAIRVCSSRPSWLGLWPVVLGLLGALGIGALLLLLVVPDDAIGLRMTQAMRLQTASAGYFPPTPTAHPEALDGDWQAVTLPHASALRWEIPKTPSAAHAAPPPTRLTWYRLAVPPLLSPLSPLPPLPPLHLFIPNWKFNGTLAIYADGALVYQTHANHAWNNSNQPHWIALPDTAQSAAPRELLFRVQHAAAAGEGLSSVWIGSHAALYPRYVRLNLAQTQLLAAGSAAFLATGLFALLVWWRRRSEPIYLRFFLMSACYFMSSLHGYVGEHQLLLTDAWFGWLTTNATLWMLCPLHLFLEQLHGRRHPRIMRALLLVCVVISVATLPAIATRVDAVFVALSSYLVIIALASGICLLGLRDSLRAASRDGCLLAGWGILIALSGAADWAMQSHLVGIENVFLTKHASLGIVFVFWYIMFRRYVSALRGAENAQQDLAQRLHARETELAGSYARLREIEQRELLGQERQRLMQDMHDGLGSSLRTALWVVEKGRLDETAVADVLKGCIDDLKLAIDSMEPVQADLLLLLATWRFRLEPRLENTGIRLRWEVVDVPALDWLDPKNALHILRILQEAFANIIKHADATEIRVSTGVEGSQLFVAISDNGRGFDVEQALRKDKGKGGKGLANQLRRADSIQAEISLNSTDAGTHFKLRLPIKRHSGESI